MTEISFDRLGSFVLTARWLAPMTLSDGPELIERASVVVRGGTIVAVGPRADLVGSHSDLQQIDLGDSVILPGLVNAHCHLELSNIAPAPPPRSFTEWILGLRSRSKITAETLESVVTDATHRGVRQCLQFGVTTVGDITQHSHVTRPILTAGPIRTVSFGETLGLGAFRWRFDELLARSIDRRWDSTFLRTALSPHAPYTVDLPGYLDVIDAAKTLNVPIATHLAETPDELPFLERQSGPFRDVWDALSQWSDDVETFRGGPIAMAEAIGLLEMRSVLAHVNYCDDTDLALLAKGRASIVYCPRTHAYFGHPPHRWREMMIAGINVSLGTDSCASSPDLNLMDDARLLHRVAPEIPAARLFEMMTIRGARALSMDGHVGSLSVGKYADIVAFPISSDHPLEELMDNHTVPLASWVSGRQISPS